VFGRVVKIGTDAVADGFGFADVEDALLIILEKINSGKVRQVGEFIPCGRNVSATFYSMAGFFVHFDYCIKSEIVSGTFFTKSAIVPYGPMSIFSAF